MTLKVTIAQEQVWKLHYNLKKCRKLIFSGMMPYDPQNMKPQNPPKNPEAKRVRAQNPMWPSGGRCAKANFALWHITDVFI